MYRIIKSKLQEFTHTIITKTKHITRQTFLKKHIYTMQNALPESKIKLTCFKAIKLNPYAKCCRWTGHSQIHSTVQYKHMFMFTMY